MNKTSHFVVLLSITTIVTIFIAIHELVYDPSDEPILGLIFDSVMLYGFLFAIIYVLYLIFWFVGKLLMRLGFLPLKK